MTLQKTQTLTLSDADYVRLMTLINQIRASSGEPEDYLVALEGELRRARILPPASIPPDVVTMNSTVRLRDLDTDETETYTLVYPEEADPMSDCISVLAPIGTAIIGYREGDTIEWRVPAGWARLQIEKVIDQPERSGVPNS